MSELPEGQVPELQRPRCAHVDQTTGAGCLAYALKDSEFCFYHDQRPEIVAKRLKALRKGGKKTNSHDGLVDWPEDPIDSLEHLRSALSRLFNAGAAGELATARLTALASLGNALSKTIEGSAVERRLAELERKVFKETKED